MKKSYISHENPIVVAGCARSGTTLMSILIGSHPEVFCGKEYPLLSKSEFSLHEINAGFPYLGGTLSQLRAWAKRTPCHTKFIEELMQAVKVKFDASLFLTKSPYYTFDIFSILENFPNAKVIFMCRDGRDVANSFRKYRKHLNIPTDAPVDEQSLLTFAYCADTWRKFVNAQRVWHMDHRCLAVKYEDLVSNPEKVLKSITNFVGIKFDARMLHHDQESNLLERHEASLAHLQETQKPIKSNKIANWRKSMREWEVLEFENRASSELTFLGYPTAGEK